MIQVAQRNAQRLARFTAAFQRPLRLSDEVRSIADAREPVEARQRHEVQLRALGPVGPQGDEQSGERQQRHVQAARLDRLGGQLPLQLQHVVLLVERVDLQAVGEVLVTHFLIGQMPCADIVEVGLVGSGILLVVGQRRLEVAGFLGQLVKGRVGVDERLGILIRCGILDGIQAELLRQSRHALLPVGLGEQRVVGRNQPAVAGGNDLVVVLFQQCNRIVIAPLVDVQPGGVRADVIGEHRAADLVARVNSRLQLGRARRELAGP